MGVDSAPAPEHGPLAALTRRLAAGDEAAFREFHAAYFQRLFRYVLVLTRGDEPMACDTTQDTLLRVVRHARPFEEEKIFWDWLTRLARSAAADHGRKTSRYRRMLGLFLSQQSEETPAPEESPLQDALALALQTLPEPDRELLLAKYERGDSVRELSATAGVTEEAIESRLARARRALREAAFHILRHETDS
jgi:RNA polymerase sigma-70 factor (ECF subfamily)